MFTSASSPVTAIQLAATVEDGTDFAVVPCEPNTHTHWSLYLRLENGEVQHQADFARSKGRAYDYACKRAVELSIEYQVPVEPIP